MGGKIWSTEEESIYWRVIVPQSDKRAGSHFVENHKSWGDLAKIMQSLMGAGARREYTHLSLFEHYFQNIKKRPSPNAITLVVQHKKARYDAGQDPNDTTEPKDESSSNSSKITHVNKRDVIAGITQDADLKHSELNHEDEKVDDGNAGHDGPTTVDQPASSTVGHNQTPVAQMGVNVSGLSTTAQNTPSGQLYQAITVVQRPASASEPKRAPAHRYNYRSSPYDNSRARGQAISRQKTRGTADGSAPAHLAGYHSYLPTPGYGNQTPQTQQNNYAGGWMSQNQPRPTAGYHMGPGPNGSLVGHRFKTPVNTASPVNDSSYGAYQGLPQTHSQQPRFDPPHQLTGGPGTHQQANQQTHDGGNNAGTYGRPNEAQSRYEIDADEHSENNGYNVVDTPRALSQARESYYSRNNSAHGAMSQSYQTHEPQSLKLPPIRDVLQVGSPYAGQYNNSQASQYAGQHAGQPTGQYACSHSNIQYGGQYTDSQTGHHSGQYAGQNTGQYAGQYANQTTGQYAGQHNTPYASQYSGQYACQHTTPSTSYNAHHGAPAAEQQVQDDRESHTVESEGAAESQWVAKLQDEFAATFGQPHGQGAASH